MTDEIDKYTLVGGQVYKLAESFVDPRDAVALAKELSNEHHVYITKAQQNLWAIYWRPRDVEIQCSLKIT